MKPPKKGEPVRLHRLPSENKLIVGGEVTPPASAAEAAYFANYAEYAKTLRAWLVAYGIGGPVLLITNETLLSALKLSPYRNCIVDLFLLGVALQVGLSFINKWCAWHMYVGEYDSSYKDRCRYKLWFWINERSWIDMLVDGSSLLAFAISTGLVIHVLS